MAYAVVAKLLSLEVGVTHEYRLCNTFTVSIGCRDIKLNSIRS